MLASLMAISRSLNWVARQQIPRRPRELMMRSRATRTGSPLKTEELVSVPSPM